MKVVKRKRGRARRARRRRRRRMCVCVREEEEEGARNGRGECVTLDGESQKRNLMKNDRK
jgi:hypothetical protein